MQYYEREDIVEKLTGEAKRVAIENLIASGIVQPCGVLYGPCLVANNGKQEKGWGE